MLPVSIEDEMKSSFMDYAMSVIVARALPDVRDGLKPVHRRILYAQHEASNLWNRPYVKCARIVGEVLGKFHPHGDGPTYDALVRMAQDFAMRYPLIDGQGNFGSIDGDPPAAYRYTECRMQRLASEMLLDIEKETVAWRPNYDDKEMEPDVLPTRLPNLLLNGTTGIAVGMATNIPPHNLREVVNAVMALIDNPDLDTRQLIEIIPGPDFPTAGLIQGRAGIFSAYETGRGRVIMRGRAFVEEIRKDRDAIIVSEVPYMVNKASWIEQCAELVRDKRLEGIADIRDESDRDGIRVVFELKRDASSDVVLNNLYKMTNLQCTFGVNMLAIVEGRPQVLALKEVLQHFIAHRREVVTRRSLYLLKEARLRREIVEGLGMAIMQVDRVIDIIRSSKDPEEAKVRLTQEKLMGLDGFLERAGRPAHEIAAAKERGFYLLSERQAQAILEMRLARLTGLEREKLEGEFRDLWAQTDYLEALLADDGKLMSVIKEELIAIRDQYGDDRRTEIVDADGDLTAEELIAEEEMIVTVTQTGYVKRTAVSEYRMQRRGGRGVTGARSATDDFVSELYVASTHDNLLIFTNKGRVYVKRVFEIPAGKRDAKGKAVINLLDLQPGETVLTMLPIKSFDPGWFLLMATAQGQVKKTELDAFAHIRSSGIKAIGLEEGDDLVAIRLTNGEMDVVLATRSGKAIRFQEDQVRPMGREARGVRGITLKAQDDAVVGVVTFPRDTNQSVLTVCERGFGKRTQTAEYPTKNRGGQGVISIKTSARNGQVVGIRLVADDDHLIFISDRGKLIRIPAAGVPLVGRATQGVRVMRVDDEETVVSLARLAEPEDEVNIEAGSAEAPDPEDLIDAGTEDGDEGGDDVASDE